jgi:hypothetical protein
VPTNVKFLTVYMDPFILTGLATLLPVVQITLHSVLQGLKQNVSENKCAAKPELPIIYYNRSGSVGNALTLKFRKMQTGNDPFHIHK